MRDSCCPKCNEKIKRIDNLPIFSYINLSAKCRNCKVAIPARYLIVELVVAAIFGSLFLYELVTGAANVPGARSLTHEGILWIIMYPKWDVIAIYFFHAAFMSMLLVLSLIERDRQKLKWYLVTGLLAAFVLPATIYSPLQPVQLPEFISALVGERSVLAQLVKLLAGGLVGGLIGICVAFAIPRASKSTLIPAMVLTGVVVGWQSVVHVSMLFVLIMLVGKCLPRFREFMAGQPTTALLIAVIFHHPFWKFVFEAVAV